MEPKRFEQLFAAARTAYTTGGDDLAARSKAKRQYRQTIDLLQAESDPAQWARVLAAIDRNWQGD